MNSIEDYAMDLWDKMQEIQQNIRHIADKVDTEEATKNAFVMPFIQALGYNVFNPMEVVPEFTADHGIKKGEKVDYVINQNNQAIILIECKKLGASLNPHCASQLFRYFSVSEARFSILTDGNQYLFFTDLDKPNRMDERPFFSFKVESFDISDINQLKKFTKNNFNVKAILTTASDLKYTHAVKVILKEILTEPTQDFVKCFASKIYSGRLTQPVISQFTTIVQNATQQFINEQIDARLKSALSKNEQSLTEASYIESDKNVIETTQHEMDAFNIVRAILRQSLPIERITLRDTQSYCGVLLDDNNRKPICRFHFNTRNFYIGLFKEKKETKTPIESIDDIFNYANELLEAVSDYNER